MIMEALISILCYPYHFGLLSFLLLGDEYFFRYYPVRVGCLRLLLALRSIVLGYNPAST